MTRPLGREMMLYGLDVNAMEKDDLLLALELYMLRALVRPTPDNMDRMRELNVYFVDMHRQERRGTRA